MKPKEEEKGGYFIMTRKGIVNVPGHSGAGRKPDWTNSLWLPIAASVCAGLILLVIGQMLARM